MKVKNILINEKNEFIEVQEDGTRLNKSEKFSTTKTIEGLEISNIKLTEKVLLPISSKEINVEYNIPISLKMIQGAIPNYYFNGIESKSIVVPTK